MCPDSTEDAGLSCNRPDTQVSNPETEHFIYFYHKHCSKSSPWPEGSFPEVSSLWQREWFYITAARSAKWVAAPAFRSGPPPQLTSWISRGLSWGPANDVPILQSRIRDLFERDFSLVMVMQVMLVRRVQPCKRRPLRMWEFNPEGPRTIQHFLGMMLEEMYQLFFGPQIVSGHHRGCGFELQPP